MWKRLRSLMAELLPNWVKARALRRSRASPHKQDGGRR